MSAAGGRTGTPPSLVDGAKLPADVRSPILGRLGRDATEVDEHDFLGEERASSPALNVLASTWIVTGPGQNLEAMRRKASRPSLKLAAHTFWLFGVMGETALAARDAKVGLGVRSGVSGKLLTPF